MIYVKEAYVIIRYHFPRSTITIKRASYDTTMTEEAPTDVKRRRLSTANTSNINIRCIADLPSGILAHAASFLAAPSKALFAIALNENSAVTPNERSSAIVGNDWDTLDFGEIENEVVERLSDLDIERVLQCIDAVNNVKRLKLTNCTNITGTCLQPLRGSAVIEQIDLSLVGNESPDLDPEPSISCQLVLPILDSIIEREGCALMHLHFPSVWRKEPSTESEFRAFNVRYNEMYVNRGVVHCLECNESLPGNGSDGWIDTGISAIDYGIQWNTCHACLKHYCYGCDIDGEQKDMLHVCAMCGRDYCKRCSEMTHCFGCDEKICNDCYKYECVKCNQEFCSKCVEKGKRIDKCVYCDKFYCRDCNKDDETDESVGIFHCSRCDVKSCDDCRLQRDRQGLLHCPKCIIQSVTMGESLERKQLQDENKQLKVEMEELKREIRELNRENEELKLENEELRAGNIE